MHVDHVNLDVQKRQDSEIISMSSIKESWSIKSSSFHSGQGISMERFNDMITPLQLRNLSEIGVESYSTTPKLGSLRQHRDDMFKKHQETKKTLKHDSLFPLQPNKSGSLFKDESLGIITPASETNDENERTSMSTNRKLSTKKSFSIMKEGKEYMNRSTLTFSTSDKLNQLMNELAQFSPAELPRIVSKRLSVSLPCPVSLPAKPFRPVKTKKLDCM